MTTTSVPPPRVALGRLRVVPPSIGDARFHTAAVIISIHVIGITALGFRVSVPQILAAIFTAGAIDVFLTYRKSRLIVWPASGLLTGSGVALILRLVGMERGDFWSWSGWYVFAGVAGVSVLTKHLIRHGGRHLFNPSNLGLVAAFLLLGSSVVEPLDFWWAPMGFWMAAAYLIILGGGIAITRRLQLVEMAFVFWVVFAASLAVLALSSHCISAAWSPDPVCGQRFWSVVVTSPELLIFVLFMITDPKTVPSGRLARVVFAVSLAFVATLLIAPQTIEWGAKVALLTSLVLWSPLARAFGHYLPASRDDGAGIKVLSSRMMEGVGPRRVFVRGAAIGSALVLAATAIVVAGIPARSPTLAVAVAPGPPVAVDVDPSSLPPVTVGADVAALNTEIDAEALALDLAEALAIEGEAIRRGDGALLGSADAGPRLVEMQARLDAAIASGERLVAEYRFEKLSLDVARTGEGQAGAALSFAGRGELVEITYDALGAEQSRDTTRFESTFILRDLGAERWLLVEVAETGSQ